MIAKAVCNGCRKSLACDDVGIDIKTHKRWCRSLFDQRRGPLTTPANKLSSEEKDKIIEISTSKEFMNLSPRQIVPRLADKGMYIGSESSFYRALKERHLLKHRGKSKEPTKNRPKPLIALSPNEIFSWDITFLKTSVLGQFYYLYMFMDIFSRKIVGWEIHDVESSELSSKLIDRICKEENITKDQLVLHSDNGASMKGATMLATLQRLGVAPSFSRPKVSDDNPFSESLFKTLKYCPKYPSKPFSSLDDARTWVEIFVEWYNHRHLHSGINFIAPSDKHLGKDEGILNKRKLVYETAKLKNPIRWSGDTRNWSRVEKVYLNYLQERDELAIKKTS